MLQLLLNAEIYAPEARGVQHLLIAGERIAWMGSTPPAPTQAFDAATYDLGGRRVVPGFIDGHVHVTGGGGEAGFASRIPPLPLSQFTRGGTTTVIGLLGTDDVTRTTASLVAASRALRDEGLSAYCLSGGYHIPPNTLTGSVRQDLVHVDPIIGVGEIAISDHRSSQPTLDAVLSVVGEAYVGGMLAGKAGVTHLHIGDGDAGLRFVREALERSELPARVFNPTHVNRRRALFGEALELAARGCTIDVTTFPETSGDKGFAAEEAVRLFLDSGAPAERLTISTDAGGSLPEFDDSGHTLGMDVGRPSALGACFTRLVAAGMAVETALPMFTSNVAAHWQLPRKGRLQVGGDADLLVLDDAARVTDVMARGRWHVRESEVCVRGTYEKSPGDERHGRP